LAASSAAAFTSAASAVSKLGNSPEARAMRWATSSSLLVVDDDFHIRWAISLRLGAAGYFVLQAANASAAIRILSKHHVDLICTDVEMPGLLDGLGLATAVHARWPLIKIVVMSGRVIVPCDLPRAVKFVEKAEGVGGIVSAVHGMMPLDPRIDLLAPGANNRQFA